MRSQRRRPRSKRGRLAPRAKHSSRFVSIFKRIAPGIKNTVYFVFIFLSLTVAFSAVPLLMYSNSLIDLNSFNFSSYAAMSLAFPAAAMVYLGLVERGRKGIAERLGLGKKTFSAGNVMLGVVVFLIILSLELLTGIVSAVTGVEINTNAAQIFVSAPLWFYFFTAILSPINEEIVFRGLLVPKMGVVLSAALFGVLHYSYNSTYGIEIIAAMVFGLVSGYVYKRTGSLYPAIVAHIMVNVLTVVTTYSMLLWVH